ncbi:hypothetical protein KSP39_PZI000126 [Platanthera zijinensis]|uniref:Integrase catalytic domain-containing protein n=1 Tax=Platanthera zijinensis TaxID=2320716 RepID=A0AAP0C1R4_9ASPA
MAGYSFPHEFPTIDPISFDLIVYGSGLPESLLAAAASSAGKTVLHLDPNPFYGSHFASLPLPSFSSSLQSTPPSPSKIYTDDGSASSSLYHAVDLEHRHVYSEVEFSVSSEPPGSFILDLSGPRVLYCADLMVDLMLRSGASHHVEFKSVERSLFYWEGQLFSVPGSRQDIFTDRSLTLAEKRHLAMLLELVQDHIASCKSQVPISNRPVRLLTASTRRLPAVCLLAVSLSRSQRTVRFLLSIRRSSLTVRGLCGQSAASLRGSSGPLPGRGGLLPSRCGLSSRTMGSSVDSTGQAASPPVDRPTCPTDLRDELRITTISLSGKKNFLPWAHSVRRVLQAKGLLSYLTQAPPAPPTDDWLRNDGRVQTWLLNSLDGEPYQMAMYHETAKSIWDELHSLYSGKDSLQHLYDILTDLVALDAGGAPDMTSFVARAKTLAEAWILHQPSTSDHAAQRAQKEAVCIAIMMARLPPHLQTIRTQVLASPTVPSLSEICSMLLRVTPPPDAPAPTSSALLQQAPPPLLPLPPAARGGRSGSRGRGRGGRGRPKCSYCGKDGHLEATCYRKNGYPPRPTASVAADASSTASPDLEAVRLQLQHLQGLLNPPPASLASTFVSQAGTACLSTGPTWIMDSGATHHITSQLPATYSDSPHPRSITVANGALVPVSGSTDISLSPSFPLRSALHVPSSPFNLLSVGRLTADLDCSVIFNSSSFVIQDRRTRTTIGKGGLRNGLYLLDTPPTILSSVSSVSSTEWHRRLGHAPLPVLQRALPDISLHPFQCESCILGKQPRSSYPAHCTRSSAPFDLLHSDVWGPYKTTSISGFRYFITFIDDYSRMTWLYLLRDRSELPRIFRAFVVETRTQFHTTIKTVRTDNAREYTGHDFATICSEFGIIHQTSCAYTPQQNGVAERKNRHLLDVTRSLMLQMHVPKHYWNFAVSTACFLINRLPSSVLQYATPFSLLFPSTPAFPLPPRIFGSTCYVHHLGPPSDKLDPRAAKHIFVGYSRTQKGYLCYSPVTRKLSVSADVTFRETQPFFSDSLTTPLPSAPFPPSIPRPVLPVTTPLLPVPPALPPIPPAPPIIRVYTRRPRCSTAPLQSASTMVTPRPADQVQTSTAHPLAHYVSLHRLSPHLHAFATSLSSVSVPNSVQEALEHPSTTSFPPSSTRKYYSRSTT